MFSQIKKKQQANLDITQVWLSQSCRTMQLILYATERSVTAWAVDGCYLAVTVPSMLSLLHLNNVAMMFVTYHGFYHRLCIDLDRV